MSADFEVVWCSQIITITYRSVIVFPNFTLTNHDVENTVSFGVEKMDTAGQPDSVSLIETSDRQRKQR